jgi:hypothetical protein
VDHEAAQNEWYFRCRAAPCDPSSGVALAKALRRHDYGWHLFRKQKEAEAQAVSPKHAGVIHRYQSCNEPIKKGCPQGLLVQHGNAAIG